MAILESKKVSGYAYTLKSEEFMMNVDVPKNLGGENLAPDPHRYLEAALAGCTVITIEMYAKRKKIPLESVNVKISIIKEGPENQMLREVEFFGPLTEEDKSALLVIADKCPVHNFLVRGSSIETREMVEV